MVKFNSIGGPLQGKGIEQRGLGGKAGTETLGGTQQAGSLLKEKAGDQLSLNSDMLGLQREAQNINARQNAPAYDETVETTETPEPTEPPETAETDDATKGGEGCGSSKGKGKGKGAGRIPPGIAKKSSADLPDGNPWKAVLAQREADEAEQVEKQKASEEKKSAEEKQAKEEDAQLMTDLMALMQNMMQTMEQLRKPAAPDAEKPAEDISTEKPVTDKPAPAETDATPAPKEPSTVPAPTETKDTPAEHKAVTTGPLDDPTKLQQEIQSFNHFDAGNTEALVAFLNKRFPETTFTIQGPDLKYTLNGKEFLIEASGESFPR